MSSRSYRRIVEPRSEEISAIVNGLISYGLEQIKGEAPDRIAIVCEESGNNVIGGATGHSIRQRFYLTQLWVAEENRCKGIGAELIVRMEEIAKERNCHDVVVDTLNCMAVSFYERLGYRVYMVNPNYIQGFDWHFLAKEVGQSNTALQPTSGRDAASLASVEH